MMRFSSDEAATSLVVHSHLRWDFVWQRPQQLLSRFSERLPVLFVEEPVYLDDVAAAHVEITRPLERVYRVVPKLPGRLRGKYDESIAVIRDLVRAELASSGSLAGTFDQPVQWFYTPMPAPAMIGAFNEVGVVYDCMDELSKFRFAPTELVDREGYLMAEADVVFTGGYKLMQSKKKRHGNVHFFGCGVDTAHFGKARLPETEVAPEIARLTSPIAGYYGVIDERLDYELINSLATTLPDMAIVMVGPVVKVDPRELPQHPNIHWLGQRSYEELPSCVKGFDVCLMPFALNEATEYINPTKTLEYMAAGKPIVSTPIADVVHHFTPVVAVAPAGPEFAAAVCQAVERPNAALVALGLEQARNSSWESIVSQMDRIIRESTSRRSRRSVRDAVHQQRTQQRTRSDRSVHAEALTASSESGDD
jgi:glycosyltransferase involved in cell wall biosynthesis